MPVRSSRKAAALLALGIALAASGCGSSSRPGQSDVRLQREDLIATARALARAQPEAASEVAAAKTAWPVVAHGLPQAGAGAMGGVAAAARRAGALKVPSLFGQQRAAGLTGPGASLAGTYRN